MDTNVNIGLNINGEGAINTVGSLKAQLRQAQAEVAALSDQFGATSVEAANAARKAADLADRIGDAKLLTDAFNPDAKFKSLSNSIGGVLNGFQAYQGALGLMGIESKDFEQTLLKVQSAMALTQGINGALEAKDAFKALGTVVTTSFNAMTTAGKAFAVTGIGLLITAIGLLIANWDTLNGKQKDNKKQQEELIKLQEKHKQKIADESGAFALLLSRLSATNKGSKERSTLIKEINSKYGTTLKNMQDERDFQKQINGELENYLKYIEAKLTLESRTDVMKANIKTQDKLRGEIYRTKKEIEDLTGKQGKNIQQQEYYEDRLNYLKDEVLPGLNLQLEDAKDRFKNYGKSANDLTKTIDGLTNSGQKYADTIKDAGDATADSTDKDNEKLDAIERIKNAEREYNDLILSDQEAEIKATKGKYDILIKDAVKYGQDTKTLEDAQKNAINEVKLKYIALEEEQEHKKYLDEQELLKEHYNKQDELDALRRSLQTEGYSKDLDELIAQYEKKFEIAGENNQLELEIEEAFKRDKAALDDKYRKEKEDKDKASADKEKQLRFDTIQASIQMTQAALSIISDAFSGQTAKNEVQARKQFKTNKALSLSTAIVNTALAITSALSSKELFPGQRYIEAALTAVAGGVQIAKIAKTQFGGFSGGGGNDVGAGGTQRNFQQGFNPNTFQALGQVRVPDNGSNNSKVYVVESDITSVQNRVSVIESRSYLGG